LNPGDVMQYNNRTIMVLTVSMLLNLVSWAYASHCFCHHCGCSVSCNKICRLVCEDKKVEVVCWGAVCEDFCLPCHGKRGCEHCEVVCDECSNDAHAPVTRPKRFIWTDWLPTKATMHTRTKLMKKTVVKTVPTYKWVVEELCPHCQERCQYASVTPEVELPTVPVKDAVVLYGKLPAEAEMVRK
jgi:hypothetical protein